MADAQAGVNSTGFGTITQRDIGIGFVDTSAYEPDGNFLGTSWSYLPANGDPNPNNVNAGFIQFRDLGLSTITSASASWNAGLDTFSFSIDGANAGDSARLWNAPATTGVPEDTAGNFLSYHLNFSASGLAATWDNTDMSFMSQTDPTAVTGNFNGLFENTSTDGAGFYTFDLSLSLDSWVYGNRGVLSSTTPYASSVFATPTVIPEPATTTALLGLAVAGFAFWGRRRVRR